MRFKLTFLLLALNAVLFGFIFFLERVQTTRSRFEDTSRLVLAPDFVQGLDRIRITPRDGLPWELQRHQQDWLLASPLQWKANPFAVQQLIFQLQQLAWESRFPVRDLPAAGQSLESYQLDPPHITLDLFRGSESLTLAIGATTEIGNRLYLLSPDEDFVLVAGRGVLEGLAREAAGFVDRRVFSAGIMESRAIQIQDRGTGGARVRLERRGDGWHFTAPIEAVADPERVEALLAEWQHMEVEGLRAAAVTPEQESSALRLSFEATGWRETLIVTVAADGAEEPASYTGRRETWPTAFQVPTAPVQQLRRAQEELREKRVLLSQTDDLSSIEIQFEGLSTTLQRLESGDWQVLHSDAQGGLRALPADAQALRMVQDTLRNLEAERFISDAPAEADLVRYGLDEPQRRVILRRAQGAPVEVRLGGLHPDPDRTLLYATTSLSSSVFLVRPHVLAALPLDPLQYRERTLARLGDDAAIVDALVVHRLSGLPVFSLAEPDPLTEEGLELLRGFLIAVRVEKFLPRPFADPWPLDRERTVDWPYLLELQVRPAGVAADGREIRHYYLSERLGGAMQYLGDPQTGLVGLLPGDLIEVLDPLLARFPAAPDLPPAGEPDPGGEPTEP